MNQRHKTYAPCSRLSFPWKTKSDFHPTFGSLRDQLLDWPPSLNRSLETTSTFQRSMSHKRHDPSTTTLPSSTFKFACYVVVPVFGIKSKHRFWTDPSSDFGGSSRICVLFGELWKNWLILRELFSLLRG